MAQTGFVSFEALRWLRDAKAAFIHLDYDGSVLTCSSTELDDARLRRAQALMPMTEHRVSIARELLGPKLRGQLAVLDSFGLEGADSIRDAITVFEGADRLDQMLIAEAKGAEAYWNAWAPVRIEFAKRDNVPDHWRTFGNRRSSLTMSNRNAITPHSALLNYLYTLAGIEVRIALACRGLDDGLGIWHSDEANRPSLVADCVEPVRPHVDAFVLNLLRTRTFSAKDFVETREDGASRLASPLTHELAPIMAQ